MRTIALVCGRRRHGRSAGCNTQKPDNHDADVKAISDGETQWNADWASKDVGKIISRYADEAVVMVPGAEPFNGKAAVADGLKPMVADPALAITLHANKVDVAGDLKYTAGSYR